MTPSLGSMAKANSACCRTAISDFNATAVARIAAATSAVLLAIPFFRGTGLSRCSRASTSSRPRNTSDLATARLAFGELEGPHMRPEPFDNSTVAVEKRSTGQVTITGVPSNMPWASSPQVPGAEATPRIRRCPARPPDPCSLTSPAPSRGRPAPYRGAARTSAASLSYSALGSVSSPPAGRVTPLRSAACSRIDRRTALLWKMP